jgi:hypothetical protein
MKNDINNKLLSNIFCFDVFLEITKYLDICDIYKLFIVTKGVYKTLYLENKEYINKILIRKILSYFNLQRPLNLENSDINNVYNVLMKTYNHFKYHRSSYIIDFLLYMLENKLDCDILFEYYANLCEYKYDYKYEYKYIPTIDLYSVSLSDIIYIFKHSNNNQLNIILRNFTIPITVLDFVIDDMLLDNLQNWRFMLIIDYMFYKHCFGSFDQKYKGNIHNIIINLILNKRTKLLKQFLKNKKRYFKGTTTLDYQILVHKIIHVRDKKHLQLILDELKYDNINFTNNGYHDNFVIIRCSVIKKLCEESDFRYLKYLADEILGDFINYNIYIHNICEGLKNLLNRGLETYKNIVCLSSVLNDKSKCIINSSLKKNIFITF